MAPSARGPGVHRKPPHQPFDVVPRWMKADTAWTCQVLHAFISLTYLSAVSHCPLRDTAGHPIQPRFIIHSARTQYHTHSFVTNDFSGGITIMKVTM